MSEIENAAQDMAKYTPRHVIEGWVAGLRANGGPADELAVCERALEIRETPQPIAGPDMVKTEKMLEDWRQADEWMEHLRQADETLHGLGDFDGGGA